MLIGLLSHPSDVHVTESVRGWTECERKSLLGWRHHRPLLLERMQMEICSSSNPILFYPSFVSSVARLRLREGSLRHFALIQLEILHTRSLLRVVPFPVALRSAALAAKQRIAVVSGIASLTDAVFCVSVLKASNLKRVAIRPFFFCFY